MYNLVTFLIYAVTVVAWGTAFFAAKLQAGVVPLEWSVAYRFALAAPVFFIIALATGRSLRVSVRDHVVFAALGLLLFSVHFLAVYESTTRIPSGLTAVGFSIIVIFNTLLAVPAMGARLELRTLFGTALGLAGIALVYSGDLGGFAGSASAWTGIGLAVFAAAVASGGNLVSARIQRRGVPIIQANAWGMSYGALAMALYAIATDKPLVVEMSVTYVGAMAYLVLLGTVVAFYTYLSLIHRIGAGRAAYTWVAAPALALILSTLFEGYVWHLTAVLGVLLLIGGNVLMLRGPSRRPAAGSD